MYTNADSLSNKIHELELLAREMKYDVIAITEVLPKNSEYGVDHFVLEGYKSVTDSAGRGVTVFIRDTLDLLILPEYEHSFNPCIIGRLILPNNEPYIVGVFYRSPNSTPESNAKLNSLITQLCENHTREKLILMGDFNHPNIDWAEESCNKMKNHPDMLFLEMVQQNYLFQHCNEPTHHRALQCPNILDLILTNVEGFISPIGYLPPLGKSHHSVLEFNIEASVPSRESTITKFQINKGNYNEMRSFVKGVPWDAIITDEMNVNDTWEVINDMLQVAKEKFIPKIKISCAKNQRVFNKTVPMTMLNKIHIKRRAHKLYKKFPTIENYKNYAKARNQVKWDSRKMIKAKEAKLAIESKTNPKSFFKYVASKTQHKENISNLTKQDGSLTETDKEKASVLNNFSVVYLQRRVHNMCQTLSV